MAIMTDRRLSTREDAREASMAEEIIGILGTWLSAKEALILVGVWTVGVAFIGRLVLSWAISLIMRHALASIGLGIATLAIEATIGIDEIFAMVTEIVGMGGIP